jgi:methionyl-tRNA formyltransferase
LLGKSKANTMVLKEFKTQKQNLEKGNYFSVPTQSDFEQIKNSGMAIITAKDYQNILTNFVLKDLSEITKKRLQIHIKNNL